MIGQQLGENLQHKLVIITWTSKGVFDKGSVTTRVGLETGEPLMVVCKGLRNILKTVDSVCKVFEIVVFTLVPHAPKSCEWSISGDHRFIVIHVHEQKHAICINFTCIAIATYNKGST